MLAVSKRRNDHRTMDDWIVAIILLAVSTFLVVTIILLCRLLGVWRLTNIMSPEMKEEKTVLTKAEQRYMVSAIKVGSHAMV